MLFTEIIEALNGKQKGSFIRVGTKKHIESAAAQKKGISVIKETDMTVRFGVRYDHTKKAKQIEAARIAAGIEKRERASWCKHIEGHPFMVEHVLDTSKKYIQLFPIGKGGNARVRYFINGRPASKEEVQNSGYVNKGEWTQNECVMMTIPIESVRYIKTKKSKI